ncbi:MAG TPA: HAD hydrolase family protein [Thermoanaerobaculia bacterium]|nr:HAD hydrolase family protein [Thermoanaerobaculia bacterium]
MSDAADAELAERARRVRWLVLDVDGVLTDGRLYFGAEGEALKVFDVKDGFGIVLARRAGLSVALLSARDSPATAQRARELEVDRLLLGRRDKAAALDELLGELGLDGAEVAAIGDDLPDLEILERAALSFAPADAVAAVRAACDVVLEAPGGRGAVREMIDRLLGWREDGSPEL